MQELAVDTRNRELIFQGIGPFPDRNPERPSLGALSGLQIVSADSHICLGGTDFWYENAPAHLKERVPRVRYDGERGHWDTYLDGKSFYPPGAEKLARSMEARRGGWDMEARIVDLDGEDIAKEIAFPQNLMRLVHLKDFEAREYIFREYNRYLASLQRRATGRFYGVGVLANYWEPEKAREVVLEAAALGLKTLMLPCNPGLYPDGKKIYYSTRRMKPLWDALEEADMALCFHISEGMIYGGGGALAITVMNSVAGLDFPQIWSELVFGRVFDNHPALRVAFVEAGIHWVPGLLQNAELVLESYAPLLDYVPKMSPRDYWAKHCAATFMHDPAGLKQLDVIGVENVMWSVDYPHSEGTFGYTGKAIDYIMKNVGTDAARKILSENAIKFFRL
jgi:predicted TIM-barrel fold metal-dependent hydrolase